MHTSFSTRSRRRPRCRCAAEPVAASDRGVPRRETRRRGVGSGRLPEGSLGGVPGFLGSPPGRRDGSPGWRRHRERARGGSHARLPPRCPRATPVALIRRPRAVAVKDWDEGRLHSAVLVAPRRERRRDRRARKAAAKSLLAEDRDSRKAAAKARADELAAERRATVVLPKAGEPGPAALRTPGRLRLPHHQDTSATLAGARTRFSPRVVRERRRLRRPRSLLRVVVRL